MSDPTTPVLITAFLGALGIFIAAALARLIRGKSTEPAAIAAQEIPALDDLLSPYLPPSAIESVQLTAPEPVPSGVPTWHYRKLDFIWAGAIFLLFFSMSVGNSAVEPGDVKFTPQVLLGSIGFQITLAMITALVVAWRIDLVTWLGLRWRNWPWVFLIAPVTVFSIWTFMGLLYFGGYMKWIESLGVESVQDTVKLLQESKDPLILILMAVAAVIVAPICEEIVFRGYLYPFTKRFAGPWIAAICSGVIFSAAHGNLSALLPLAVFGFVLAVIYEKTGSIWSVIAIHFCFNGATVALQALARFAPHLIEQSK